MYFFSASLLKHSSHTTHFTHVKCAAQQCVVQSWSCATIKQPILRHFRHPKGKSCTSCRSQLPPSKASPSRRQPLTYFLHTDFSILRVSYKWNHTTCGCLWLASSPEDVLKAHPCCGVYQCIPLKGQITFHRVDRPHWVYPSPHGHLVASAFCLLWIMLL